MVEMTLHKKIRIISMIVSVLGIIGIPLGSRISNDGVVTFSFLFVLFAIVSVITSLAIKYKENKLLIRVTRSAVFISPILATAIFLLVYIIGPENVGPAVPLLVLSICSFLAIIYLFIYSDTGSLTGTIGFIVLFFAGMTLKRHHIFGASYLIAFSLATLSIGGFMYGIRALFIAGKLPYLRNILFYGSCFNVVGFLGLMFKIQHWPAANYMVMVGFISMIVGTMIVLLTLPSSGYIDWQPIHRRIFKRILLPWTLIFVLFILRYMLPEVNNVLWTPDKKNVSTGFKMSDYTIENKNGIKPD